MAWREAASKLSWYHWVGGMSFAGAINVGFMGAMAGGYRWFYADDEENLRKFRAKYGLPSERERLAIFAWMAPNWDKTVGRAEESGADRYRKELLTVASGDVLEVAVGTGRCFDALSAGGKVTSFVGVDAVEEMLEQARPKLEALPFEAKVVRADAARLPFPDRSFDTVVGTLCLCALEQPVESLNEMERVCKQGGEVLLVEPGVASWGIIRYAQAYLGLVPNPKIAWEVGWYDDREPDKLIQASRLELKSSRTKAMGNWYLLRASPRLAAE